MSWTRYVAIIPRAGMWACDLQKHIFSSEAQVWIDWGGGHFDRSQRLIRPALSPSDSLQRAEKQGENDRKWHRKTTRQRGGKKRRERDGVRNSQRLKKPRGCRLCQIHSPARVILSQSTQLGDSPWSEEQSWLIFSTSTLTLTKTLHSVLQFNNV